MSKVAILMADGCEEIEGLTVVDLLRRAKIDISMVSITKEKMITGSHGIKFESDELFENSDLDAFDGVVLPGGMGGTNALMAHEGVCELAKKFASEGKLVSAICAAPSVLGVNGIMNGKKGTSYPGFEDKMTGCDYRQDKVVVDGNIITSRGMGTAMDFGLAIIEYFDGKEKADEVAKSIIFK